MSNKKLQVNIGGLLLKNPVMSASGTFGFGEEYAKYFDINKLGAIVVKGITLEPRQGNKPPRIAETPAGILNSIGLQNPGIKEFIRTELPQLKKYNIPIIVNVSGNNIEEYCTIVKMLNEVEVDAIELNLSCPNVEKGGMAIGVDKDMVFEVTSKVKKISKKPLIVKLSPNVTDITEIAISAEKAGADAISLINTILGMAIDINTKKPLLGNNMGGLSGPAIKPIAIRMVYQVAQNIKIPIIGMGGIVSGADAIEFLLAGASAVAVGSASFVNPLACIEVLNGIEKYMEKNNINILERIIGKVELNK